MVGIPKTEIIWVQQCENDIIKFIITSDKLRIKYKLYKIVDNKAVYTKHNSENPTQLEKYMN